MKRRTSILLILAMFGTISYSQAQSQSDSSVNQATDSTLLITSDTLHVADTNSTQIIRSLMVTPVEKHITYKKIPVDGSLKSFTSELTKNGFKAKTFDRNNTASSLTGMFSGFNVTTIPFATPLSNTVYEVETLFSVESSWKPILDKYELFKKHLTEIYGEPIVVTEEFLLPYFKDDGYSMRALSEGKVNYTCIWNADVGFIVLKIKSVKTSEGQVSLTYTDSKNYETLLEEKKTIIQQDL